MIKPVLTLSLLLFPLTTSASLSSTGQSGLPESGSVPVQSTQFGCSSQAEIELGWEYQLRLIEARLAARADDGVLTVPGAILSSPFPSFEPYRSDAPEARAARKSAKSPNRARHESVARRPAAGKS